jgi:riboflavin kinase/FMN adenylyltransferase
MTVYRSFTEIPFDAKTVTTIGTFDGVHLGHRHIISTLLERGRQLNARTVVITFHPHPQVVLRRKGDTVPILTTIDERIELLKGLGVDAIVVLPFTPETAATPWEEFAGELLTQMGIAHIVFGHDHAFGKGRAGTAEVMETLGKERGFGVTRVAPLTVDGEAVSSTKIRHALQAGDLTTAQRYLGRRYSVAGTVVRGDGRGRQLGIPTANIRPTEAEKLVPATGVYCVGFAVDGENHRGMANIGRRPTFTHDLDRTIEVNVFELDRDIYEHSVTVEFLKFVRSEQKFASAKAFLEQLAVDRRVCGGNDDLPTDGGA